MIHGVDTSGNPVNYRGGMNFVWERGRSNEMHTVKFGYGGGENEVEDVSKCIYKDGYLQEYILYINILDENKGTIEGERYIFR